MGETTEISWAHHTFNPWAGCTKVSPACDNCYAEKDTHRRKFVDWGKDATRRRTSESYWNQLEKWNRAAEKAGERRRVFIGSWCDIMEDRAELQPIREELYPRIESAKWLDVLLLTKRPQNFRRFLPKAWLDHPLPNVWGMATVESQDFLWRAEALVQTPFHIRGLSVEPMLGPVVLTNHPMFWKGGGKLDWVICGGESQHGARPMQIEWARSLRDQCVSAGVAFHFKQWGEYDAGLVHIGKKSAGRLLDGRIWQEFPEARDERGVAGQGAGRQCS